jgi:lysophospholipid acyltransferase (LPLAT)-like uncharacterized protein
LEEVRGDLSKRAQWRERAFTPASLSAYSLRERFLIRAASLVFYVLISLVGRTVRFEVEGGENWESASAGNRIPIYVFWHNRIFLATYFFRHRKIAVMTSQSFDGEYIARFIQKFGYGAVRGSSTRGGIGAIVEMVRLMRAGTPTAFTLDGPKGPRYVVKMGAILLAKKTGQPILPVTVSTPEYWQVNSWDRFQIPRPFARATVRIAAPIFVPSDASDEALSDKRDELQEALDRINEDYPEEKPRAEQD